MTLDEGDFSEDIDMTPDTGVLVALSHTSIAPLDALCELIDNAIDSFSSAEKYKGLLIERPYVRVDIPKAREVNMGMSSLRIEDCGPGMHRDELEKAIRAGYSSNNSYESLGLFGMGFNISTSKYGRITHIITACREDDFATELTINLETITSSHNFHLKSHRIPKPRDFDHGTIVEISNWWPEGNPNSGFIKKLVGYGIPKIIRHLGRTYSTLLKATDEEKRVRIFVNGETCEPYYHCVWDSSRYVTRNGKDIPARFDFDEILGTKRRCAQCRTIIMDKETECPVCHSNKIRTIQERLSGWVGIQRFDSRTEFGIDLIRNGRCIRLGEKAAFFEFTNEFKDIIKDYPIDTQFGRIVGEVHMDFVPVDFLKQDFQRTSDEWARAMTFLRGDSSLQPKQPGADKNQSPVFKLYQGYRKATAGTAYMYMGYWPEGSDEPQRISRETEKEYYQKFLNKEPGYFDDEEWWKLVIQASRRPVQQMSKCPTCGAQILPDSEECDCCGAILISKECIECGEKIPKSAVTCPSCGCDQTAKISSPWECSICGTSNAPERTICSKCGREKGSVNPLNPEYLVSVSNKSDYLSVDNLSITLPNGTETERINLSVYLTNGPIISPVTNKNVPVVVSKELSKITIFVDSSHRIFKNYAVRIEELIASEVAAFIYDLTRSSRSDELSISNITWILLNKYWSKSTEVSQNNVREKSDELLACVKDRLMSTIDPSLAMELFSDMSVPQQKALVDNVTRDGLSIDDLTNLKSNGKYLQYVPMDFLLSLFDKVPEVFFNKTVWDEHYGDYSSELDAEVLKQTYDRIRSEYRNSLETILLFVAYPTREAITLQKVEAALKFLENKLEAN